MDIGPPQVQEEHAGQGPDQELVFTAQDDIDREEQSRCFKELRWRESFFYVWRDRLLPGDEAILEVYERLCGLRYRDYNVSIGRGFINADGKAETLPMSEYPDEVLRWETEPGPSLFGWTFDPDYFDLADLDDYQRILPTRIDLDEYPRWEEYRLTFSQYEADKQYVKYCEEMSKKIKWVKECMRLDYAEFGKHFKSRGLKQALKIATGFSHLTGSLAERGYDEYLWNVRYNLELEDYSYFYFEVWKRVYKQEMSFEDALKLTFPRITFGHIEFRLKNYINQTHHEFITCMEYITEHVVDDEEVFKHIAAAVYKIKSPERPKMYVDYVKKKLEVAQRIQLFEFPGEGMETT